MGNIPPNFDEGDLKMPTNIPEFQRKIFTSPTDEQRKSSCRGSYLGNAKADEAIMDIVALVKDLENMINDRASSTEVIRSAAKAALLAKDAINLMTESKNAWMNYVVDKPAV